MSQRRSAQPSTSAGTNAGSRYRLDVVLQMLVDPFFLVALAIVFGLYVWPN